VTESPLQHRYCSSCVRVSIRLWKSRGQLKCDGTHAETRFCLSTKWRSPFKSAGASVQSAAGSREVCTAAVSNAGYTMFRGIVKVTVYPLHSPVSPSLPLPYVTVCHHISTGVNLIITSVVLMTLQHDRLKNTSRFRGTFTYTTNYEPCNVPLLFFWWG
jgi:hypothetical protein